MAGVEEEAHRLRKKILVDRKRNAQFFQSLWGAPHDPGHAGKYSPVWLVGQLQLVSRESGVV